MSQHLLLAIVMKMRSQAALEYLMTYGWAILIVIIVGSALYALGIFNPGTFTGQKRTGFSAVQIEDFKFDTVGNLTLFVGNKKGKTINITNISAEYTGSIFYVEYGDCIGLPLGPNEECIAVIETEIEQRQGANYDIEIAVNFTDSTTSLNHTDFGMISGSIEPSG